MIKNLINLANHLDSKGLSKEADYIDNIIKESFLTNPLEKIKSLNEKLVQKSNSDFLKSLMIGIETQLTSLNWSFPMYNSSLLKAKTYLNNGEITASMNFLIPKDLTYGQEVYWNFEMPLKNLIADSENGWNEVFNGLSDKLNRSIAIKLSGISVEDAIEEAKGKINSEDKQKFIETINQVANRIKEIFLQYPYLGATILGGMKMIGGAMSVFSMGGEDIEKLIQMCIDHMIEPVLPKIEQAVDSMYRDIKKNM